MLGEGNLVGIFGIGLVTVDRLCPIRVLCGWDDLGICTRGRRLVGLRASSRGCTVWCSAVEAAIELGAAGAVHAWACANGRRVLETVELSRGVHLWRLHRV